MKRCVWVNGFLFYVLIIFSVNSMESKKDEQPRESFTFTILEHDAAHCSFCRVNKNYTHDKNVLFFPGHENMFFKDRAYDAAQEFTYFSAIKNLYSEIYPESNYPVGGLCFTEHKSLLDPKAKDVYEYSLIDHVQVNKDYRGHCGKFGFILLHHYFINFFTKNPDGEIRFFALDSGSGKLQQYYGDNFGCKLLSGVNDRRPVPEMFKGVLDQSPFRESYFTLILKDYLDFLRSKKIILSASVDNYFFELISFLKKHVINFEII